MCYLLPAQAQDEARLAKSLYDRKDFQKAVFIVRRTPRKKLQKIASFMKTIFNA